MKLSILIPSLINRNDQRIELIKAIQQQGFYKDYEILCEIDRGEMSIGHKRNLLLEKASGDYVCFIDDDDEVSSDYIPKIMEAIETLPDCCSLMGIITWDGENPQVFEHSIKYNEWKTNLTGSIIYERNTNHLNVVRSSIAKQFKFLDINHGEDRDWSDQLRKSGLLKTEAIIPGVIYHYKYVRK